MEKQENGKINEKGSKIRQYWLGLGIALAVTALAAGAWWFWQLRSRGQTDEATQYANEFESAATENPVMTEGEAEMEGTAADEEIAESEAEADELEEEEWEATEEETDTDESALGVTLYRSDNCPECDQILDYLAKNELEDELAPTVKQTNSQQDAVFLEMLNQGAICELERVQIRTPLLWVEDECYVGEAEIMNYLKDLE